MFDAPPVPRQNPTLTKARLGAPSRFPPPWFRLRWAVLRAFASSAGESLADPVIVIR